MQTETFKEVQEQLAFIAEQSKKNELPHEFVYKVLQGNSRKDPLENLGELLPNLMKMFSCNCKQDEEAFMEDSIVNTESHKFGAFSIDVKNGDLVKLKNNKGLYWVIVNEYEFNGFIYGYPYNEGEPIVNPQRVRFEHKHIFDYKAVKE